jgi:L-amino acid N-acyltransferase YncA
MLKRHADILDLGLPYLIAEWEGKIAGYAYAQGA